MSYASRLRPGLTTCPFCGGPAECDEVDVGIGMVQCGPYVCSLCDASQMGPEGTPDDCDEEERKYGWYRSGRVSPHANTVNGKLVSHDVAKALYRIGRLDPKPELP